MKKFGRLFIAAILLTFAMSTASFADGSARRQFACLDIAPANNLWAF